MARRGSFARIEDTLARALQIFPFLSQLRLLRHWSGTADIPMDGNAIVGATPVEGLLVNCGWGYAGFKATPASGWCFAHLIAQDAPHEVATAYTLGRYRRGDVIDERGAGAQPNLH